MEQVPSLSLVNTLITECKQGLQDRIYISIYSSCVQEIVYLRYVITQIARLYQNTPAMIDSGINIDEWCEYEYVYDIV